jgi:telomere length regulation protein
MDDLLVPVSKTYLKTKATEPPPRDLTHPQTPSLTTTRSGPISSAEEALETLKSEPDYDTLISVLRFLSKDKPSFSLSTPGPLSAQIIQVLVGDIAPNYWALLNEGSSGDESQDLSLFVRCLRSIGGINATIFRLRALIQEHESQAISTRRSDIELNTRIVLGLLESLLGGDSTVHELWTRVISNSEATKRRALKHELISLLAGGRIVSVAAEAESVVRATSDRAASALWFADGSQYSKWLGRNAVYWARKPVDDFSTKACADLLARAFRLGYFGEMVNESPPSVSNANANQKS